MKYKKNENKAGRYRDFQMLIRLGLINISPKTDLLTATNKTLADILTTTRFVCQENLEKYLYKLQIDDRGRIIELDNFSAQLEYDEKSGIPYWNIYLTTKSLTTGPCIGRAVSKKIFDTVLVDPTIKIFPINEFIVTKRENIISLPDSDWYPGYFSKSTVTLSALLEIKEVKESIKDNPNRYSVLTRLKNLTENNFVTED